MVKITRLVQQRSMTETTIDIREATLREFEDFIFDHAVHGIGSDMVWYHQFDLVIHYDAAHSTQRLIELFRNAHSLPSKYDQAKLEQGCWALFGAGFDGNLNDLIWESDIPLEAKEALISSMFFMYRDLFALDPLGDACEMWWDGLAYDINPMRRVDPANNSAHKRIQNVMFETLSKILKLDSADCQSAALHGLNHVFHPETKCVVNDFVRRNPNLSDEYVEYATLCANGQAM